MPPAIKVGLVVLCVVVMITALGLLFAGLVFALGMAEYHGKRWRHHMDMLDRIQKRVLDKMERERDA